MFGLSGKSTWAIVAVLAAVFAVFILLYVQYTRSIERRICDREKYLIRAGRLDLRQRYYDAHGNLRDAPFDPDVRAEAVLGENTSEDDDDDDDDADDDAGETDGAVTKSVDGKKTTPKKTKGGVMNQLVRTVTSGRIVHMINNFQLKTNRMAQRLEKPIAPDERVRRERFARLADASVNPLFPLRVKQAEMAREERERAAQEEAANRATATEAVRALNSTTATNAYYTPQTLDTLARAMEAVDERNAATDDASVEDGSVADSSARRSEPE